MVLHKMFLSLKMKLQEECFRYDDQFCIDKMGGEEGKL